MYRIGLPHWRYAARHGVLLRLRVDVLRDARAGVYVAASGDLRGLVCEAGTMEHLVREIRSSVSELIEFHVGSAARPAMLDIRLARAAPTT